MTFGSPAGGWRYFRPANSAIQFCTTVMKHGLGIVDHLHSGLSFLLEERGMKSVHELIGSSLPMPITPFEELPATKQVPELLSGLCEKCGNCARCPYLAISMDNRGLPRIDGSRCIGCSLCAQKCFAGALFMRDRRPAEVETMLEQ